MSKMLKVLPLLLGLLMTLLVTACAPVEEPQIISLQQPTSTPIPTAPAVARPRFTVQRGTVSRELEFTGRWRPRDQAYLAFEENGQVRNVYVNEDQTVIVGELLADLQVEEIEQQLEDAQARLQESIDQLLSGAEDDAESVEALQRQVFDARLALQRHLDNPPTNGVGTQIEQLEDARDAVDDAEQNYQAAIADPMGGPGGVDSAYEALINARDGVRDAERAYAEAAAGAGDAIEQFNETTIDLRNNLTIAERDLEEAIIEINEGTETDAELRQQRVDIERLQEQLRRSRLVSPIDGIVLDIEIQPGDTVEAFSGVLRVAIPRVYEVEATIPIGDAQQLSQGQVGICQVINRPETAVQCVIRRIPDSSRDPDQTTRVAASMEDLAEPGDIIQVFMPLETREDVLFLPPTAVRQFQNRNFVILETPDGPVRVDVEIGLETDDRVEIVSGLEEGDVVIAP